PAGPPQDVSVHLVNLTHASVTWRPPEADLQHGVITGYQILTLVNDSSVFLNKTVNSSAFSYQLAPLIPGHTYSISLLALSKMGAGPSSQPIRLQTDPALLNPLANRHAGLWSVQSRLFIVLVGGAMFFLLLVFVVLLYIRRYHNKASKLPTLNGSVTKTSNLANFYGGENLWPESGWKPSDGDKPEAKVVNGSGAQDRDLLASLAPEYAEIDSLGTFTSGKKSEMDISAEAYASASVLAACNNRKNKVSEKFMSLPQCVPLLKGSHHHHHHHHQGKHDDNFSSQLSQDMLNNTDNDDKSMAESKRPFFIETSSPALVGSSSLSFTGGGGPRLTSTPRGALSTTLAHHITRHGPIKGASPYSVNPFTSQPHLLHKGVTLTLRDLVPRPLPTPLLIPTGTVSSSGRTLWRSNPGACPFLIPLLTPPSLPQLPYACYSATRVASPRPSRTASLEGGGSPYGGSTNTYQSIEGLTDAMRRDDEGRSVVRVAAATRGRCEPRAGRSTRSPARAATSPPASRPSTPVPPSCPRTRTAPTSTAGARRRAPPRSRTAAWARGTGTSPDSSAVDGAPSDAVSCGSCEDTDASFYATCDKQTKL
ncbi:Roundabout-like protein 2, partial [Penaeus vannamei]